MTFDFTLFDGLPVMSSDQVAKKVGVDKATVDRLLSRFRLMLRRWAEREGYILPEAHK